MDNNSYGNVLDGQKAAPQAVYRCGLCLKEFLYYRDLAIHERWHLEQMTLERLPEGMRPGPGYDNRAGPPYTAPPNVPITALDSFDKLVQPFRGEGDRRAGVAHTNVRGPAPTSAAPDMDKIPQPYRGEADARSAPRASPVDNRGSLAGMDMRGLPLDSRALALDTSRPAALDSRNLQPAEARPHAADTRSLPVDAQTLPIDTRSLSLDTRTLPVDTRSLPVDTRTLPVDTRSLPVDTRTLPVDTRSLPVDTRTVPVDSRSLPVDTRALPPDGRSLPSDARSLLPDARSLPPDARSLAYSTTSFLDSINPTPLYSSDHHKIPTSAPPAFQVQTGLRPEDYAVMDTRSQPLPKLDSQVFSKPDPYYGMPPKGHYSSLGGAAGVVEKPQPNYAQPPTQYGLKLLGQPPSPYYPHPQPPVSHQPPVSQDHHKYDMDKLPSPSSLGFYNQPAGISQAEPKLEKRQPSPSPKQTLYYGQPPPPNPSHPATITTSSQYQINISKPSHLPYQNTRDLLNKPVAERPEMMRSYGSGHVSPHLTYSDVYKGSHPQSQVFTPGMPQPSAPGQAPVQQNYNFSGAPKAPEQSRSSTHTPAELALQECDCYICFAPFPNMHELSEHMKIHARENIAMAMPAAPARPPFQQATTSSHSGVGPSNNYTSSAAVAVASNPQGMPINSSGHYSNSQQQQQPPPLHSATAAAFKPVRETQPCQICGKSFINPAQLAEHMKVHAPGDQLQRFNCRTCSKGFNKLAKCTRHEAMHLRDISLSYCEICEKDFKHQGNYLYHMTMEHDGKSVLGGGAEGKAAGKSVGASTIVDCQICDTEVVKDKLVDHLKSHCAHICDKCVRAFEQKTEYVEHLMTQHSSELADSSDAKSSSENSDNERTRSHEESEDQDSGLEEDHEKDREEMEAERALADRARKQAESSKKKRKSKDQKTSESVKKKKEMTEVKIKKEEVKIKKEESKVKKEEVKVKKEEPVDIKPAIESPDKEAKFKFSCSKCDESFERKTALALHVESHVRDPARVYCEVCNASWGVREKGYFIYHMKQHTDADLNKKEKLPDKFMCDVCYKEIKRETFISHIVQQHSQHSCDICKWSYSTDKSLFGHMKKIHSSSKVRYVLKKDGGVETIYKTVKGGKKKGKVKKTEKADTEEEEEEDRRSPQTSFSCKVCKRVFSKKSSVENHMKSHNNKVGSEPVNCELCNETLTCDGAYLYHIIHNHEHYVEPVVEPEADKQKNENETNIETESKETNIATKEQDEKIPEKVIRTVLNPETGDFEEKEVEEKEDEEKDNVESEKEETKDVLSGIVYCKLCNMSLKRNTLYDHVKTEHTLFNCDLCQYSFTKNTRLLNHKKTMHLEEMITAETERVSAEEEQTNKATETGKRKRTDLIKLYTCPVCEAEFRHDKYTEHIKTHRKPALNCRFCGRKFSKKILLALHEKSHERISHENELPFARNCPVCNAGILSRTNYVEHLQDKHLQHPTPACKTCSKVFIADKILENHTRVYHDNTIRVFWTLDGEGMKFDLKTGRCSDVASDYLNEIRELNFIMKANRKPEIWTSATPRKPQDQSVAKSAEKRHARGEDSDEDYVPRKKQKASSSDTESEDDRDYKPSSQKKKTKRRTFTADDDSSSDEEVTRKSPRRGRPPGVKNKTVNLRERPKPSQSQKQTPTRKTVLRSDIPTDRKANSRSGNRSSSNDDSTPIRKKLKRKVNDSKTPDEKNTKSIIYKRGNVELTREDIEKYRPKESDPVPKNCPLPNCDVSIFNFKNHLEHFLSHLKDKPFKCPYCDARFEKERNMNTHGKNIHRKDLKLLKSPPASEVKSPPSKKPCNLSNEELIKFSSPEKLSVRLSPLKQQQPEEKKEEEESPEDPEKKYICVFCDKKMKSCWNFSQHIRWHKREMEKPDAESKPFSCKTCGEWFKKKGDLYIHMKVHGDGQDYEGMDTSKTESESNDVSLSSPKHESDVSLHADASVAESSAGTKVPALDSSTLASASTSNKDGESISASSGSMNGNSNVNNGGRASNNSESADTTLNNNKMSSSNNVPGASAAVKSSPTSSNTPTVTNTNSNSNSTTAQCSKGNNNGESVSDANMESLSSEEVDHSNNGVKFDVTRRTSSVDSRRQSESENEDKTMSAKATPPSVKKMSSESALSKWKAKVMGAMSSQLELNAAKRQEEMENPVVAKVKEKLTIEGKAPKKNFECRICGDAFDYENFFRRHMEGHLSESPPYCGICDIYFMAIYPKRRLVEHNKKKHPELCN